ncbi:MAG: DUF4388 domain-containing protein [Deltaproteobacteria bacterium]|nr:DUF4388 domain-containing protein [Deltaproteobacteria bacterium]
MENNTKKVLLAEPDRESAKVLGLALKEGGLEVLYAKDGPTALQKALEGGPDVIVTEIVLPLLNAVKISQILKSNPRVKDVPIVFLSSGDINPVYLPYFRNAVIKKPYNLEEVLTRIKASLKKSETAMDVQDEAREIEGNLAQMSLVDILQVFSMNKKSGALVVRREETFEEGMVFLKNGEVINANAGIAKGEKALYRMLGWSSGKFEYIPKNFNPGENITKAIDSLLMEGMRQIDEWKRMAGEFPTMDATITLKVDSSRIPKNLRPMTKEVISLLSYYKKVEDVINNSVYSDYDVMMTINTLISKGVIGISEREGARDKKAEPLLTAEEAFAIKESLSSPFREGYNMDIVKIPVFCSNMDHAAALAESLSHIAGFSLEKAFFTGNNKSMPVGELGKIRASDNITLLFIVFPTNLSGSPLWPPLLGDSVGVILLRDEALDSANKEVVAMLKESMKLTSVLLNINSKRADWGDKKLYQMNMEDMREEDASKQLRKLLDAFLNL